jgi:ubiquinone/menaquinone biosynthesis C-methylase UbiE
MTDAPLATPFGNVDESDAEMRRRLVRDLDRMAASPGIRRVRQVADEMLAPRAGQDLLDAGCGTGEVARALAAIVAPNGDVVALDHSREMIGEARARHDGSRVEYQVGDVLRLPFTAGSFSGVRCERVLQHLDDPDAAVRELVRVTRRRGRVVLIDTDWQSLVVDGLPEDLVADLQERMLGKAGVHTAMGRTLRRRLVRAGLRDVVARPVTIAFDHPIPAADVIVLFDRAVPAGASPLPEELRGPLHDALDEAGRRREFLAALTIWVASGVRR